MLTPHVENFERGLDELKPVLPSHYEELSLHRNKGFELDPMFDRYIAKERLGEVLYITIRDKGELAGYFIGLIGPGLHYRSCFTLQTDIFYVRKEYRGNGGGMVLFRFVEAEAKRRGAHLWISGDKEHAKMHADKLHLAIGFEKIENVYGLWLKEHD